MKVFSISFIIAGLLIIWGGFALSNSAVETQDNYATADAVVTEVFAVKTYDYNDVYYPIIRFNTQDGKEIETSISIQVNKKAKGKMFVVRYLKANPYNIENNFSISGYFFALLAFGLCFLIPGLIILTKSFSGKKAKSSYTYETAATVVGFTPSGYYQNRQCAYCIQAECTDPNTGKKIIIDSKNHYWLNPDNFPPLPDTVTVKMDPNNPKKNWMDTFFFDKQ